MSQTFNENDQGRRSGGGSPLDDAAYLRDEAVRQGTAALGQVKEQVKEKARTLGNQAREQVEGYTEDGKQVVTQHLEDFAQAIRRASDELSQRDQTMASQVVRQAANGLEGLSRSVSGASLEDVVRSVRSFGRSNPAAFLGGAVLAGLAIGRFARASNRSQGQSYGAEWDEDNGGGRDWADSTNRSQGSSGSSYPAGERAYSASASRSSADAGYTGQHYSGTSGQEDINKPAQPGSISTGDT